MFLRCLESRPRHTEKNDHFSRVSRGVFESATHRRAKSKMAYVVASKRTAFGSFGGKLKSYTAAQLGGIAGKAALAELPDGIKVDSVHFGSVLQSDPSGAYLARHVSLYFFFTSHLAALSTRYADTYIRADETLV